MLMLGTVLLLLLGSCAATDEITSLPGWTGKLPSRQFSGFLSLPSQVRVHYWLVESEAADASKDPLVLWYNGGPPCSALVGMFGENGPFLVRPGVNESSLVLNHGRWSRSANLLYLESPLGVGFTYSKAEEGLSPTKLRELYASNDTTTAALNLAALLTFLDTHPAYKDRQLFLAGESYAGIYVPMLAQAVLRHNQHASASARVHLEGMLVGNGALATGDWYEGWLTRLRMENAHSKGLLSPSLYRAIVASCANYTRGHMTPGCEALLGRIGNQTGPLNQYDLRQTCTTSSAGHTLGPRPAQAPLHTSLAEDPCLLGAPELIRWINRADVKAALHVAEAVPPPHPSPLQRAHSAPEWSDCGGSFGRPVAYTRVPQDERVTVYPDLIGQIRILIYNGDQDNCIPYTQDEEWTANMGLEEKQAWTPWMVNGQVAGYVTRYAKNFTFTTLKDAGHLCPRTAPIRAFTMFDRFIRGVPLTTV